MYLASNLDSLIHYEHATNKDSSFLRQYNLISLV